MMIQMRLIADPALPAARNMATDEALLGTADGGGPPTLRLYRWDPPAVSLGYFQPVDTYDARAGDLRGFEVIRRPTGGGAILHHTELTYSLAVPSGFAPLGGRPVRLYELAHESIRAVLVGLGVRAEFHGSPSRGNAQRGPFFCFARRHRYDLVVGGEKMVGSAQRRRPRAVLQHGTIILKQVPPQPCTGLNDHLARPITANRLADLLAGHLARKLGVRLAESALTQEELQLSGELEEKYASDSWTRQR